MNEHAGGAPKIAFIPIQSWSEESFEVTPIYDPDLSSLDKLWDILVDEKAAGRDPEQLIKTIIDREKKEHAALALQRLLSLLDTERKPDLARDQISWISGLSLMEGKSLGALAKKNGISKQAFQQGAEKFRDLLDIRSQSRRPDSMRNHMRMTNYRRTAAHD